MPHCRFFMSGCLEPACIYQVLVPAACVPSSLLQIATDPHRSTRTTTRTTEATARFTPAASARTAPTAAATTTRRLGLAHTLLAPPTPFPPLTRILLSQPMLCADYLAGFCPKGPGQLHVCVVSQQQCPFHMPVCNVAALQHAPRATPRSRCQRLGQVWAGMRALDIRRAVAPRFIVIDMEAYLCAAASTQRHSS